MKNLVIKIAFWLFATIAATITVFPFTAQAQWGAGAGTIFYWSKQGSAVQRDSLRFIAGSGASLTQSGNTLTIASTPGAGSVDSTAITNLSVAAGDLSNASVLNAKYANGSLTVNKFATSVYPAIRGKVGWTSNGTITADTLTTRIEWGGTANTSAKFFNAAGDTIILNPSGTYSIEVKNLATDTYTLDTSGNTVQATGNATIGGNVGIGTVSPASALHAASTATTLTRGIVSSQHSTTGGAFFLGRKSRGTNASPTIITAGDTLSRWLGSGYDGTNYLQMAAIEMISSGTIASTRVPTQLAFSTATDAAPSVLTVRMRINNAGNIGIATNTFGTNAAKTIAMANGTAPSAGTSGQISYYSISGEPTFMSGVSLISTISHTYGALYLTAGAVAVTIPAATQWVKITGLTAETSPATNGCTVVADSITVVTAGTYEVHLKVDFTSGSATNDTYRFAVMNDQTVDLNYLGDISLTTASGTQTVSLTGLYTAAASGDFSIVVRNLTDADDPTLVNVNFIVKRIN